MTMASESDMIPYTVRCNMRTCKSYGFVFGEKEDHHHNVVEESRKCIVPDCIYFGQIIGDDFHIHKINSGEVDTLQKKNGSEGKNSYRVPLNVRYDLIPPVFLEQLAKVYEEGAQKYGDAKYIEKPLPYSTIINHMLNHFMLFISGDRSELHMAKVAWGAATLINLENLISNGFIDSTCDVSANGAKVQEALTKRNNNAKS